MKFQNEDLYLKNKSQYNMLSIEIKQQNWRDCMLKIEAYIKQQ